MVPFVSISAAGGARSQFERMRQDGAPGNMSLIENSLTLFSYKQPQQQQNKTSDKPHGWRDRFVGSWKTAEPTTRLQDALLRGPEEGKSWESWWRGGWGRGAIKPGRAWQSRAVAPFTVVVNLEINGDTVLKTKEGSCIVAVESFTQDRTFVSHFPLV